MHPSDMNAVQSDADLIVELVARYTADPVPPCRVCGGALSIQSFGGGDATVWGCGGMEDDPHRPGCMRYKVGRSCADDHYSQSTWRQYRGGDSDVIELAKRFHALAAPQPEWQPIETAPRDRRLELWIPRTDYHAGYPTHGKFDDDKYGRKPRPFWSYDAAVNITHARERQPTHWRHEPENPNA